jgi:hypothetical protein
MKNIWFYIILLSFVSCIKADIDIDWSCENCLKVRWIGKIYEEGTNKGMSNIALKVRTMDKWFSFDSKRTYAQGKTDSLGNFILVYKTRADSISPMEDVLLEFFPNQLDSSYIAITTSKIVKFKDNETTDFKVFPKTKLILSLKQIANDSFNYLSVNAFVKDEFNTKYVHNYFYRYSSKNNFDSTLLIGTAANLFTKIELIAGYPTKTITITDSIFCKKGELNTFNLKF